MEQITFFITITANRLTLMAESPTNFDKATRKALRKFVTTISDIETWLREFHGIYYMQGQVVGWTGDVYRYVGYFRIECECEELRDWLHNKLGEFELNETTKLEDVMAIRKAPFRLWGTGALRREILNNTDKGPDEVEDMSKDDMVNLLMSLAEKVEDEPLEEWDEEEDTPDEDDVEYEEVEVDEDEVDDLGEDDDPEPEEEPVPELTNLGEGKIVKELKKKGLWNDTVAGMTIGDKKAYLHADTISRARMIKDIKGGGRVAKKPLEPDLTTPEGSPEPATDKKTKEITLPPPRKEKKKTTEKPAESSEKHPGVTNVNAVLKEKGLWRKGMQFLSAADKEELATTDSEKVRQRIFKATEKKMAAIKSKQSKTAKTQATAKKAKDV